PRPLKKLTALPIKFFNPKKNQPEPMLTAKTPRLQLELSRNPNIICIQERQQISPRNLSAFVTSSSYAPILLAHYAYAASIAPQCIRRVVGRAIVNDYHFKRS